MVLPPPTSPISTEDDEILKGIVAEPDKFFGETLTFNHQQLVMTGIAKCLDLGSKELKEGWWEEKIDKQGNMARTYHEDSRKAFVESVKSLLMVVSCDFDEEANAKVRKLIKEIKTRKEYWLNQEWQWWVNLTNQEKDILNRQGKNVMKGFFNAKLSFDNYFYEEETDLYREVCTEINHLTKRLNFYESATFTG